MTFVKMYSANWCHDCRKMLAFFEENNIVYEVVNVDHDDAAVKKLMRLCGGKKIVPTLEVEGNVLINPTLEDLTRVISDLH